MVSNKLRKQLILNIPIMDKHHTWLIALLQKIVKLTSEPNNKIDDKFLTQTVKYLYEYTSIHFPHEESIMKKHEYPDLKIHAQAHKIFWLRIDEIVHEAEQKNYHKLSELSKFLLKWLGLHIGDDDTKLAAYLHDRKNRYGLEPE